MTSLIFFFADVIFALVFTFAIIVAVEWILSKMGISRDEGAIGGFVVVLILLFFSWYGSRGSPVSSGHPLLIFFLAAVASLIIDLVIISRRQNRSKK